MKTVFKTINRIIERLLVLLFALLVIDVLVQVGSRYILGQSYSFTEELARFALIWLSVLGAAYLTGKKEHLHMDFLFDKLEGRRKLLFARVTDVLIGFFSIVVLIIGGSNLCYITLDLGQKSPALGAPLGLVYLVVPLSGVIIIFYCVYNFIYSEETLHLKPENN